MGIMAEDTAGRQQISITAEDIARIRTAAVSAHMRTMIRIITAAGMMRIHTITECVLMQLQ